MIRRVGLLDGATIQELIVEIQKRYSGAVFIGSDRQGKISLVSWGSLAEQTGLLYMLDKSLGTRIERWCDDFSAGMNTNAGSDEDEEGDG